MNHNALSIIFMIIITTDLPQTLVQLQLFSVDNCKEWMVIVLLLYC